MTRAAQNFIRFLTGSGPRTLASTMTAALVFSSCTELQQPRVEPFYAVTVPPVQQELRWSNGKPPKSLDPARAAAAPETDIVRAVYEGLTDLDSRSLREIPGVAERWESSEDLRTWTFYLRKDARWSNGELVTAGDFVNSWKRLVDLGEKTANRHMFENIVGTGSRVTNKETGEPGDFLQQQPANELPNSESMPGSEPVAGAALSIPPGNSSDGKPSPFPSVTPETPAASAPKFGVEAVDDVTLRVSLQLPDKDFPKLVANPIFRPIYANGAKLHESRIDARTITNGAFRIAKVADDGITLERSDVFWNRKAIALEKIRFVPANSAETALEAYRKGEIDVVTNAAFEPLALKLLAPYEDFRRTTHSALNFYEFNADKAPFKDRRVREALAIAIDRTKLTDGDLEGTTQPAYDFFPLAERRGETFANDTAKARDLLSRAGYPDGKNFPPVRFIVNRNNIQQRVAASVVRMWKQNLNIDVAVEVRESSNINEIRENRDFDILRRGVVLPTNNELVNIQSVVGLVRIDGSTASANRSTEDEAGLPDDRRKPTNSIDPDTLPSQPPTKLKERSTLTKEDLLYEVRLIPLYFPTSYSLVKPYIRGFEMNGLDAPSLKEVSVDTDWQQRASR